jgi:hypothetical protein
MIRDILDYFVLDSLADDIESLEQIIPAVHDSVEHWNVPEAVSSFDRNRIAAAIIRLVRENKVAVLVYDDGGTQLVDAGERVVPDGPMENFWFRMTSGGRLLHTAWEPPPERTPA